MLNPVNSSIIAVALVSIGHAFGVGASATTWLVSALYLATAIGQPTMGRLADLVGPRRVYLAGTAAVAAGGLLGYLGWSLGSLIAARIVIGLGTSAAYPAAMTMVRHQARRLNREAPGGVLGALAIAGQATMAVGPPLGGLLIAVGGWRLTFLVNVPLAVAGIAAVLAWLPADDQRVRVARAWHELDPPGLVLFAAALTGLLLFLMSLASPRWWLLGVTAALLAALTARELRARTPFLDVRMLARNRALTTTYVRFGITMLITYGFIYGWTPWLEQSAGLSAADAGFLMVPSFAVAAVVSALAARHSRIWPLLVAGAAALAGGLGRPAAAHRALAAVAAAGGQRRLRRPERAERRHQPDRHVRPGPRGLDRHGGRDAPHLHVPGRDRLCQPDQPQLRPRGDRRRPAPPRGHPHRRRRRAARRHPRRPQARHRPPARPMRPDGRWQDSTPAGEDRTSPGTVGFRAECSRRRRLPLGIPRSRKAINQWLPGLSPAARPASGGRLPRPPWTAARPSS